MWKSPWLVWGAGLGVALGGFFDGILLHQILQWHHLLSLVDGLDDMRLQVLWDGWFHALMYVLAAVAIWRLWRAERAGAPVTPRALGGVLLIGFGLWHVLDGVLSHWLLGIHRIRVDSPEPLMWDLIWFTGFGLLPMAVGGLLAIGGGLFGARPSRLSVLLLAGMTAGAGIWAGREPGDAPFTTVAFAPQADATVVAAALADADARLVWADPAMAVVVAQVAPERRWRLWRAGALYVGGAGLPPGCLSWSRLSPS